MNCEQIAELLPDYLQGTMAGEDARQVENHLRYCAACADEVAVCKKLSGLPNEQPSPESRARFDTMLRAFPAVPMAEKAVGNVEKPKRGFDWNAATVWLRTPVGAVAWSLAILVIGILAGTRIGESTSARSQELAAMHAELTNTRQLVVLSMLQQTSASERLQGVMFTNREDHLDPRVLAELLRTLRYDSSVDVRLAALDALSHRAGQPQVRKSVVDALQEQQSPLVQVALIDLLADWRDPDAAQRLRNFQQLPDLNPAVRQRAQWAVSKLQ